MVVKNTRGAGSVKGPRGGGSHFASSGFFKVTPKRAEILNEILAIPSLSPKTFSHIKFF